MCVLSLNIINDKIFLLEWCWFFVLAILTSISLVGTAIFVTFPSFRKYWIRYYYTQVKDAVFAGCLALFAMSNYGFNHPHKITSLIRVFFFFNLKCCEYAEFVNVSFFHRRKARMWNESDRDVINMVLGKCYVGDCFLLHLLSKNTNSYIFKRIIKSIGIILKEHKSSKNTGHSTPSVGVNGGSGLAAGGSRAGSIGGRYSIERLDFGKNGV